MRVRRTCLRTNERMERRYTPPSSMCPHARTSGPSLLASFITAMLRLSYVLYADDSLVLLALDAGTYTTTCPFTATVASVSVVLCCPASIRSEAHAVVGQVTHVVAQINRHRGPSVVEDQLLLRNGEAEEPRTERLEISDEECGREFLGDGRLVDDRTRTGLQRHTDECLRDGLRLPRRRRHYEYFSMDFPQALLVDTAPLLWV
mmetsp:Transcript_41326/g.117389  ORF Transcript_41326/g.117389 Transcript_41326/m.117389 type:complete len:204 (-) Transcript_41326:1196-1807(-)